MWPFNAYNVNWPRPFDGRAPPVPQNANPSHWLSGSWQPNPNFNWQQPYSQGRNTWVPSQGGQWQGQHPQQQQQQQQQQSFNPYKRVPKPPSAEYMATQLSDNPLGLTNMVTREELYGPAVDGIPPETPWVWKTTALQDEDDEDEDEDSPSTSQPSSSLQKNTSSRHATAPSSFGSYNQSTSYPAPARYSTDPSPSPSEPPPASSSPYGLPEVNGPLARPQKYGGSSSASAQVQAYSGAMSVSANPVASSIDVRELRPTFSPRIVRTPDHYRTGGSLSRSNSLASTSAEPLAAAMERISTSDTIDEESPSRRGSSSRKSSLLSRQSSQSSSHTNSSELSSSSMSGVDALSDEPTEMLSPLMLNTPFPPPAKPLGRHHTAPNMGNNGLTSIPEDNSSDRATPGPTIVRHASEIRIPSASQNSSSSHTLPQNSTYSSNYASNSRRSRSPPPIPVPPPVRQSTESQESRHAGSSTNHGPSASAHHPSSSASAHDIYSKRSPSRGDSYSSSHRAQPQSNQTSPNYQASSTYSQSYSKPSPATATNVYSSNSSYNAARISPSGREVQAEQQHSRSSSSTSAYSQNRPQTHGSRSTTYRFEAAPSDDETERTSPRRASSRSYDSSPTKNGYPPSSSYRPADAHTRSSSRSRNASNSQSSYPNDSGDTARISPRYGSQGDGLSPTTSSSASSSHHPSPSHGASGVHPGYPSTSSKSTATAVAPYAPNYQSASGFASASQQSSSTMYSSASATGAAHERARRTSEATHPSSNPYPTSNNPVSTSNSQFMKYSSASTSATHDRNAASSYTTPVAPVSVYTSASSSANTTSGNTKVKSPTANNPYDWRSGYSTNKRGKSDPNGTSTRDSQIRSPPPSSQQQHSYRRDSDRDREQSRSRGTSPQVSPSSSSGGYDRRSITSSRHSSSNPSSARTSPYDNNASWTLSDSSPNPLPHPPKVVGYDREALDGLQRSNPSTSGSSYRKSPTGPSDRHSAAAPSANASSAGSGSISASAAAAANEMRRTSQNNSGQGHNANAYRSLVRQGYWNKRGDHLTPSGYVVYAPPDRAYPHELSSYPPQDFRNETGMIASWTDRPQLPDSMPTRNGPPLRPYEQFIIYMQPPT
ncbi:hypothetical protein PM082_019243 [Marasmius tenuissimus]|nr:hypothetical protein PM082_019243 [Marasmius tenuissimus]